MAHVGYKYPVHFRRDCSQNISVYRLQAYANRYLLSADGTASNPWTPGFPTPYLSGVGDDTTANLLVFTWPSVSFNGHTWQLICTAIKPATPSIDVYQRIDWFIDGTLAQKSEFGGFFFGDFQKWPAYAGIGLTSPILPPPYAHDFGFSRITGFDWSNGA